jgi:hypothetical protein
VGTVAEPSRVKGKPCPGFDEQIFGVNEQVDKIDYAAYGRRPTVSTENDLMMKTLVIIATMLATSTVAFGQTLYPNVQMPSMNFDWIGNLPNAYEEGRKGRQEIEMRRQEIEMRQLRLENERLRLEAEKRRLRSKGN